MNYQQAKREMDAAEQRLMFWQEHCTVATLPNFLRARRAFDRTARVAHDALWEEIREQQTNDVVVPIVTSSHVDELRRQLEEAKS
jgi:hypothetical protein